MDAKRQELYKLFEVPPEQWAPRRHLDERWKACLNLWQLKRLWTHLGKGNGFWALAILIAGNRETALAYSQRRVGPWVKVGRSLLPGIGMPSPRTKRAALRKLQAAGLVELKRSGERSVPLMRMLSSAEAKARDANHFNHSK